MLPRGASRSDLLPLLALHSAPSSQQRGSSFLTIISEHADGEHRGDVRGDAPKVIGSTASSSRAPSRHHPPLAAAIGLRSLGVRRRRAPKRKKVAALGTEAIEREPLSVWQEVRRKEALEPLEDR